MGPPEIKRGTPSWVVLNKREGRWSYNPGFYESKNIIAKLWTI